jgi:epoxyqueuosine reductase QueG
MDKSTFEKTVKENVQNNPLNFVAKEIALRPILAGMKIFDEPLFGYASADDPLFLELKKKGIIGPHFMAPAEWLPEAKSIVSLFFPFTKIVREANKKNMDWPADEWLHARIEGQVLVREICGFIVSLFEKDGFAALGPMLDSRFSDNSPFTQNKEEQDFYTSNWSERHVAYAAGLGTFGLSCGLITQKGMAGRFTSVISSACLESENRPYTDAYDYCTRCGVCVKNCPGKAISLEKGKSHFLCSTFLDETIAKHKPRYGCGKCQVKVPCEFKKPGQKASNS